jgi:hypothetical protein
LHIVATVPHKPANRCIRRFGLDPNKYQVLITNKQERPQTKKNEKSRKKEEGASIRYTQRRRIFTTNQKGKKSKEAEYLFEVW